MQNIIEETEDTEIIADLLKKKRTRRTAQKGGALRRRLRCGRTQIVYKTIRKRMDFPQGL
jgi:hypothetical protein